MIMIDLMSSHALKTSGMLDQAIHIDKYLSRRPYRTPKLPGIEWVMDNLHDPERCYTMFRMNPEMFHKLHEVLTQTYGLKSSRKSTSLEALVSSYGCLVTVKVLGKLKKDLRGPWVLSLGFSTKC